MSYVYSTLIKEMTFKKPFESTRLRLQSLENMLRKGVKFKIPYWKASHPTHYFHGVYQMHPVTRLCQPFHQCSNGTARTGIFLEVSDAAKELLRLIRDNSDMRVEDIYTKFLSCEAEKTRMANLDLWWPEPFPLPPSRTYITPLDPSLIGLEATRKYQFEAARDSEIDYLESLQPILQKWQNTRHKTGNWDDTIDLEVAYPSF
jgi:hypothetical protein